MTKFIYVFLGIAILAGLAHFLFAPDPVTAPGEDDVVACTMDAMMCPDGSYVGRTGPSCEFVCPQLPEVPADVQAHIDDKADLIQLTTPVPNSVVGSPLIVSGQARGYWFFEASFPVYLTNWDGLIIAEGVALASGDWMTEEFVPFTATLEFVSPYPAEGQDFMKRGALILKKDNPSGLPEKDDALEIPINFAP
jgi:hypothetical protein